MDISDEEEKSEREEEEEEEEEASWTRFNKNGDPNNEIYSDTNNINF